MLIWRSVVGHLTAKKAIYGLCSGINWNEGPQIRGVYDPEIRDFLQNCPEYVPKFGIFVWVWHPCWIYLEIYNWSKLMTLNSFALFICVFGFLLLPNHRTQTVWYFWMQIKDDQYQLFLPAYILYLSKVYTGELRISPTLWTSPFQTFKFLLRVSRHRESKENSLDSYCGRFELLEC